MAPRGALVMTFGLVSMLVAACDDVSQKKPETDVVVHGYSAALPLSRAPDLQAPREVGSEPADAYRQASRSASAKLPIGSV